MLLVVDAVKPLESVTVVVAVSVPDDVSVEDVKEPPVYVFPLSVVLYELMDAPYLADADMEHDAVLFD